MTLQKLTPQAFSGHGSMLFSLEVDHDSPLVTAAQQAAVSAQLELLSEALQPLLTPRGSFYRRLLRDVMLFRDILLAEEDEVDGVVLASKLTAAGYRVAVREALGGGSGVAVFSNLRHSFLIVTPQDGPDAGTDYIVEPHFREQFEISHPTRRYAGLLAMLPSVLVCTAAQLAPLVQLLCSEMSLAFEEHGLSLPPWRQSKSLLSKWLPSKSRDLDLSPYSSPRASSPEPFFPLSCFAAAAASEAQLDRQQEECRRRQEGAGAAASESASGTITPAAFSGDDASPRAVLRGASAALLTQQQQHAAAAQAAAAGGDLATGGGVPPAPVRKSLLSSCLAAGRQRSSSPPAQPQRAASEGAPAQPLRRPPQPPLLMSSTVVHHGPASLAYRVSSDWQQPAIRTVKMQGHAVK